MKAENRTKTRVLYIGDPSSVHDLKWVSYFSSRSDFEAFFLVQEHEMHLLTPQRKQLFNELQITVEGPIKSYSLWRFWENRASLNTIRKVIADRNIDVVHPLFATPFSLWTRGLAIPSIITTRGSDVHVVLAGLGKGSLLHKLHGKLLRDRFRDAFVHAAAITCTSKGQLDRLNELLHTDLQAQIIRTGVNVDDIDRLKPVSIDGLDIDGKQVVFLPRYIRPIYRTELQVRALAALPAERKALLKVVLISGNRTDPDYLDRILSELNASGLAFQIIESLSQPEMWSLFKLSKLSIMTPRTDGTPNSALEAMAARCPLILGAFDYDEDLFSERFCLRLHDDSVEELTARIVQALDGYPQEKLEAAFWNVSERGNRPVEMERLRTLYLSIAQS